MTTNSITEKFKSILDHSLVLSGDDLKSRFYHIWKTDISLESVCLLTPKTTKQVSEIIKICSPLNISTNSLNKKYNKKRASGNPIK